jgi:tRNA (guanine37-N1)-methyltransferase
MRGEDILGNIAILKFDWEDSLAKKKKEALRFLKEHNSVRTVLEKTEKFSGRLRTLKTRYLAGEKNLEALYRENGCEFRFNVESCYFSSRLSSERKKIAGMVKKGENVLVMFGGVAPFAIAIAKLSNAKKVVSIELGKECNKYAVINVKRNKVEGRVEIIQGDVRKKVPKLKEKFSRIVMARPNLKESFLDVAFRKIKKGGIMHYYGFYEEGKLGELAKLIEKEALKAKKKIKILEIEKAGDIGAYKFRYRADLKILN